MVDEITATPKERDNTDTSLRVEREKTDGELASKIEAKAKVEGAVVEKARDRASEVLTTARTKEDRGLAADGAQGRERSDVARERAQDDRALQRDHATSDERRTRELTAQEQALGALLERERAVTDEHLRVERARADRALNSRDEFLAVVSHDIRTLLTAIALEAELLIHFSAGDEAKRRGARSGAKITRLTGRMNRLVGDLIDVVAIDSGKLRIDLALEDASGLAKEALEASASDAASKGQTLEVVETGRSFRTQFDRHRVLQVLTNLVGNAIKFTPNGGRITICADATADALCFSVEDTGPGIPEEKLALIFERFWQAGESDRRGLGLGLYICRSIVEAHGGRIWAEGAPGEGAIVRFTLPVAPDPAGPLEGPPA